MSFLIYRIIQKLYANNLKGSGKNRTRLASGALFGCNWNTDDMG